nr:hypothetical protein [Acidocella sp.]
MIMERGKIGFVTGLTAEARWLRNAGFMVGIGGGTPLGAERAAEKLVCEGAQGLISFGLAGGIQPGLVPGSILVPPAVTEAHSIYPADYRLSQFLGGALGKPIYAGKRVAASVHDKELIYNRHGPCGIDLESGAVARVARRHGIPFAVLRAVADPADFVLPPAALVGLKEDGAVNLPAILRSLLRHPRQLPALLELAGHAKAARAALLARLKKLPERTF